MPKFPSLLTPAIGFMCWSMIIMISESESTLFYLGTSLGCAFVTTLVYSLHVNSLEKAHNEARISPGYRELG